MAGHLDAYLSTWHRVHKQTTKLMATAPSGQDDWKPSESAMTLGKMMNHMRIGELAIVEAAINGAFPKEWPADISDKDELIAAFDAQHAALAEKVAALTPEQLNEVIAPFGPGKEMPRQAVLQANIEHEIHHRGQLYVYLRALGCEVPALFG